jgi:hypothetical protein
LTDAEFLEDCDAMAEGDGKLVTNPTVVSQETNEGAVLLEMTTGDCFELNRVGAEIWGALSRGEPLPVLVAALARRYDVPAATIEADANALIAALRGRGLVNVR